MFKLENSKSIKLGKIVKNVSNNPKVWIVIGIGVAGIIIFSESRRRRKLREKNNEVREDFGAFIERFEILPSPQPPPPAARLPLSGLTFAVKDMFVFSLSLSLLFFASFHFILNLLLISFVVFVVLI